MEGMKIYNENLHFSIGYLQAQARDKGTILYIYFNTPSQVIKSRQTSIKQTMWGKLISGDIPGIGLKRLLFGIVRHYILLRLICSVSAIMFIS